MTAARRDEAGSLASSQMLAQTKTRGSGILAARIYGIVSEVGEQGMTVSEIYERMRLIPGFDADTAVWAENTNVVFNGSCTSSSVGYRRVQQRVHSMRQGGMLITLSRSGRTARYAAGRKPKAWRHDERTPAEVIVEKLLTDDVLARDVYKRLHSRNVANAARDKRRSGS